MMADSRVVGQANMNNLAIPLMADGNPLGMVVGPEQLQLPRSLTVVGGRLFIS